MDSMGVDGGMREGEWERVSKIDLWRVFGANRME
jgi:hypothetical protein